MKRRCCFLSAASSQQILCTNASNRLFCVCFYSLCVTTISRMKQAHLSFNKMKMKNQFSIHFPFRPFSNVFHLYFFSFVRSFARWLLLILFYFYCLVVSLRSHFCVTERKHECVCVCICDALAQVKRNLRLKRNWNWIELDWVGHRTYTFTLGLSHSCCSNQHHQPRRTVEHSPMATYYLNRNKVNKFIFKIFGQ